ncbi:MAG: carboxypeptidase regulatory-like domain-containing protein, partial [Planctomycetota bacterium]
MLARDRSGSPAGPFDVRIRYLGAPKDFPKDAKILGQKVAERKGRGPGVEGRWEVAELYPGRYWIAVSSPVFAPAAGSLELAPGEHGTFSLTLIPAGFLRGRIVSPDGEPVSGAHIGLDAAPGIRMDEDLWTPHTGSATSGPDGGFRTGPLHPGTYLFSVQTKGFPFFRSGRELEVEEGQETDLGEIRLPAGFTLKLRVTETDGTTPVADAGVEYAPRRDSPSVMSSWRKTRPPKTDAHGRVSISQINAGPWEIRVQSQGHARKELEVEVGPDLPEEKIVALDEELTIAGVVRDRNHGAPVERADVTAFPAGQDDMTRAFDSVNGNQRPLVVTAEDGTFRIGGLGPGRWVLRARHSAYAPLLSETVETALGKPEPRVTLLLSRGATLHVQLLDSDGAPLTGKIINLTRDGSFTTFGEDTDGAGQATFQNLAAGAYSLFVVLGEGATASGHVRLAEDEEAEVVLGGGRDLATVEGLVTRAGEPVAGLTLSLHGVDAAFPAGASTDERGFYRFEKDPAGFYDLDV